MIVWKFVDGKPGHEQQTSGLIAALQKHCDVEVVIIDNACLPKTFLLLCCWFFRIQPVSFKGIKPDLIIGAGHQTHLPMLVAKSLRGGFAVVLMKPSICMNRFDLVVVPEHDGVVPKQNVLEIKGVLNAIDYTSDKSMQHGLILIGGESAHYVWDNERVLSQVKQVVEYDSTVQWVLTTSRRTPASFLAELQAVMQNNQIQVIPYEETNQQWMLEQFKLAGQIWVSPDSVSMVYESLSSGAVVRVFSIDEVQSTKQSRVVKGLSELVRQSYVGSFDYWVNEPDQILEKIPFNEAQRVADVVREQLQ